jgi:hypothetical protein
VNPDLAHLIITYLLGLGVLTFGLLVAFALFSWFEANR